MASGIGRDRNYSDTATTTKISLNSNTAVKIADANAERINLHIAIDSQIGTVWIKLQPAGVDDEKIGIPLSRTTGGKSHWPMPTDSPYTGEICAIAEVDSPDVYVTEF